MFSFGDDEIRRPPPESNRIVITNLHPDVSEEELMEFLSAWNPRCIFIPYEYEAGFRHVYSISLGVAYIWLESIEDAKSLINDLQYTWYHNRCIKLFFHEPFKPNSRISKKKFPMQHKRALLPDTTDISTDTLYCHKLPMNCTDTDLKTLVEEYSPVEIWIFKRTVEDYCLPSFADPNRTDRSALVKLETNVDLQKVIKIINKKKLCGKKVRFIPALKKKVAEVRRATQNQSNPPEGDELVEGNSDPTEPNVTNQEAANMEENPDQSKPVRSQTVPDVVEQPSTTFLPKFRINQPKPNSNVNNTIT